MSINNTLTNDQILFLQNSKYSQTLMICLPFCKLWCEKNKSEKKNGREVK